MSIFYLVGIFLFLLAFVYFGLQIVAFYHTKKSEEYRGANGLAPWWPFNQDIYDDFGQKLCSYGRKLFYPVWIGGIAWFVLKYNYFN